MSARSAAGDVPREGNAGELGTPELEGNAGGWTAFPGNSDELEDLVAPEYVRGRVEGVAAAVIVGPASARRIVKADAIVVPERFSHGSAERLELCAALGHRNVRSRPVESIGGLDVGSVEVDGSDTRVEAVPELPEVCGTPSEASSEV